MPLEGSQSAAALVSLPVLWEAPAGVGAFMSTRAGGVSTGAYAALNLGTRVGDDPAHVATNRQRFGAAVGAKPCWLHQVHSVHVVDAAAHTGSHAVQADASWTCRPGVACTVQVADCMPVLLAARNGRAVGAAHAGWRGLAGGVVEATLAAVARAAACDASDVMAWLGPCIGPRQFEVGADVLAAFGADAGADVCADVCANVCADPAAGCCFVPRAHPDGRPRWLADLPGLARLRLQRAGITAISGGTWCTVESASRFFSFRRSGVTGRMAAAVWLAPR